MRQTAGAQARARPRGTPCRPLLLAHPLLVLLLGALAAAQVIAPIGPVTNLDGSGNNVANPALGSVGTPLSRASVPSGFDALPSTIKQFGGSLRPLSARDISHALFFNSTVAASVALPAKWPALLAALNELVYYDLVELASNSGDPAPIAAPRCDPELDEFCTGSALIPYNRVAGSNTGPRGERQATNLATAYLDLEFLYELTHTPGTDVPTALGLRTRQGGLLNLPNNLLPIITLDSPLVIDDVPIPAGKPIFQAGDLRINRNPALVAITTLYAREHNRRARELKANGTFVLDEDLFQAARRFTIGQWQHLVNDEVIGSSAGTAPAGYTYSATASPAVDSFFAACASRFFLSNQNSLVYRVNADGSTHAAGHLDLASASFDASAITSGGIDPILRGLMVNHEVQFGPSVPAGLDSLFTRALHRSIDLGVPNDLTSAVNASTAFLPPKPAAGSDVTTDVSFNWTLSEDKSAVAMEVTTATSGWLALGIGPGMPGMTDIALVQWVNGAPMLADGYTLGYRPSLDAAQTGDASSLNLTYWVDSQRLIHYRWSRPLLSADPYDLNITTSSSNLTSCVLAYGTTGTLGYHGARRYHFQVDFFLDTSATNNSGDGGTDGGLDHETEKGWPLGLKLMHGFFMVSAFFFAIPSGIVAARYIVSKSWLEVHQSLNIFVVSQVFVSLLSAVIGSRISILLLPHGTLGIIVASLLAFVFSSGLLGSYDLNVPLSLYRLLRRLHAVVGLAVWVGGLYNSFLGIDMVIDMYPELEWLKILLAVLLAIVLLGLAGAEVWRYRHGKVAIKNINTLKRAQALLFKEVDEEKNVPEFSWDEINLKISEGLLWLVIDDNVYDVTQFVDSHPGDGIRRFIGVDATDAFEGNVRVQQPKPGAESLVAANTTLGRLNRRMSTSAPIQQHMHSRRARLKLNSLLVGRLKDAVAVSRNHLNGPNGLDDELPVPSWIPHTASKGLSSVKLRALRLIEKQLLTGPGAAAPVYRFRLAFSDPSRELWCLPGDSVVLQLVDKLGKVVMRSYTPVEVYSKGHLDLVIKLAPDANKMLAVDSKTNGCFDWLTMISAGSGLTPMLLWLEYLARFAPRDPATGHISSRVCLLAQYSSADDVVYVEELQALQKRLGPNAQIVLFVGDAPGTPPPEGADGGAVQPSSPPLSAGEGIIRVAGRMRLSAIRKYLPPRAGPPSSAAALGATAGGSRPMSRAGSSRLDATLGTGGSALTSSGASGVMASSGGSSGGDSAALLGAAAGREAGSKEATTAATTAASVVSSTIRFLRTGHVAAASTTLARQRSRRRSSMAYTPLLDGGAADVPSYGPGNSGLLGGGPDGTAPADSGDMEGALAGRGYNGSPRVHARLDEHEQEGADEPGAPQSSNILICGPAGFNAHIVEVLLELGYSDAQVTVLQ
ncbi:hypothetical protein H9P43_010108 [Blastocladiella emersonii ATCC 22665]|nr:hypothetical protein H9P43_010108 [Blastocladiella emersonii ATCC 22665]